MSGPRTIARSRTSRGPGPRRASTSHASRPRSTDASTHSTPARFDPDRTGIRDAHRPPQPAGIAIAVEEWRLPIRTGDRALRSVVVLRWRMRLRSRAGARRAPRSASVISNVCRANVSFGRAEVFAVEPHVAVVRDAVELEEGARRPAGSSLTKWRRYNNGPSLLANAGSLRQWCGNAHVDPGFVDECGVREIFREIGIRLLRAPRSRQIEQLTRRRVSIHEGPAYARRMSRAHVQRGSRETARRGPSGPSERKS